jgi:hypothetical protein
MASSRGLNISCRKLPFASLLHSGHTSLTSSHSPTQPQWKWCPQDSCSRYNPGTYFSRQIMQCLTSPCTSASLWYSVFRGGQTAATARTNSIAALISAGRTSRAIMMANILQGSCFKGLSDKRDVVGGPIGQNSGGQVGIGRARGCSPWTCKLNLCNVHFAIWRRPDGSEQTNRLIWPDGRIFSSLILTHHLLILTKERA